MLGSLCVILQVEAEEPRTKKRLRRAQQADEEAKEPGTAGPHCIPQTAEFAVQLLRQHQVYTCLPQPRKIGSGHGMAH